jgi:predicted ester cyclase
MLPIIALMRRYCERFVNAQDPSMCAELLANDYVMNFAGRQYLGRADGYEPAVKRLFVTFPDLHITMHELLTDGDRLATRFTLCGHSTRHGGNQAAWGGIAIYTWDGTRFTSVWVEEDHHLARRQLHSGECWPPDQRPGPPDPWSARPASPPSEQVLHAATGWLGKGGDGRLGDGATVDALLVVGSRFAFHTSHPNVKIAGMASITADHAVSAVSIFSDGGTP